MPVKHPERQTVSTRRELAELFGVSMKTVDSWKEAWKGDKECPNSTKSYDVMWVAQWLTHSRSNTRPKVLEKACELLGIPFKRYADAEPSGAGASNGEGKSTYELKQEHLQEQIRKDRASADQLEIKNRTLQGDLCTKERVRQWGTLWFTHVRATALRIPQEMAAGLPAKFRRQIVDELTERIEMMLRSSHTYLETMDSDLDE